MLEILGQFSAYCTVTLSLNKNEFEIVCGALDWENESGDIEKTGMRLRETCALECLVVHLMDGAYAFSEEGFVHAPNRYIKEPVISTGGGDNFNAGLTCGLMLGMNHQSAMIMANAVSGYYVTYGKSPSMENVLGYIREWKESNK